MRRGCSSLAIGGIRVAGITMRSLFIVWNDSHNLGVPIIDEQHRGIVSTINSLFHALGNKHGEDVLKPIAITMQEYTKIHFATEEDLLARSAYPSLEAHRQLHNKLIQENFLTAKTSMRLGDPRRFLVFLKDWWLNHINRQDRLFAEHVKEYMDRQFPDAYIYDI